MELKENKKALCGFPPAQLKTEDEYMAEKITVQLIGQDGNIFHLMAVTRKALIKDDQKEKASEMVEDISRNASTYNEALVIIMKYVDVE